MGLDFPDFGQAEHLEATAVSQNGKRPVDKPVKTSGGANDFQTGPYIKMVRIAEDNLRAHLPQFTRVERLDAALSTDGHKNGRIDGAARGEEPTQSRFGTASCF